MKLQNRLKSYTVVLLLSPLLFLGVAEWRDWQKECERTLHRAKNTRENGRVLCRENACWTTLERRDKKGIG